MSSVVISGDTSGAITLQAPAVSGNTTLTLPTTSGTVVVANGAQTIEFADGSASAPSITNSGDTNTGMFFPAADTIAFAEGGVEAMRLDASGNVGIGTSSPSAKLQVTTSAASTSAFKITDSTNYTLVGGYAAAGVGYFGGDTGSAFALYSNNTERMRIDSNGNVLVGRTTTLAGAAKFNIEQSTANWAFFIKNSANNSCIGITNGSGTAGYTAIGFYNNGESFSFCGAVSVSGTTTTYSTSSDYRLKENVSPMIGALETVNKLNPVTWTWKSDGSDGQGFIAHELQAVVPDCVTGKKDDVDDDGNPVYQGVDTSFLVATLTKAIQELKAIVDEQAEKIKALEAK